MGISYEVDHYDPNEILFKAVRNNETILAISQVLLGGKNVIRALNIAAIERYNWTFHKLRKYSGYANIDSLLHKFTEDNQYWSVLMCLELGANDLKYPRWYARMYGYEDIVTLLDKWGAEVLE